MGSKIGVNGDTKSNLTLNPVSIWWVCWAGIWTVAVALGMAYLVIHRSSTPLRIRGLGLSLSAVVLLHLYWISVQLELLLGTLAPGDAEFWVMGTLLPCGIALFHASNSRFIHVANLQKKYARHSSRHVGLPSGNVNFSSKIKGGLIRRFRRLDYTTRSLIAVGIAMLVQIFLTVLMYIISRKWHSSWGIPGTELHGTAMEQKVEMGRGWEWWPGVFWQFLWSWIVAPFVLWKSRAIHDTQGWRVQTIGCAIASFHATPLWLIALYVPSMATVNKYWLPPQWICLSITFLEIFTVFLPCWEVVRHQSLRQETLDLIAEWESRTRSDGADLKSLKSVTATVKSTIAGSAKTDFSVESVFAMPALEYALDHDPTPLQQFSALHDFSGENIAFLTSVAQWKKTFERAIAIEDKDQIQETLHERFNSALFIYAEFISAHAEFPINLGFQDFTRLESIFERPARMIYGDEPEINPIAPFDTSSFSRLPSAMSSEGSEKTIRVTPSLQDCVRYWGEIPEGFIACGLGANIFDDAVKAVKYLVLTNTWPKFVKSRSAVSHSMSTFGSGLDIKLAHKQAVK
ncbi:uncharacterized protein N7482_004979 [Penicillium canariense]|uniref:RGS domain-containing protein n=1 Tax=Penicillium canariense TaxID=189055 RepID=A0A9W9I3Y8_9EURO|nr:uncharacterized protein N7482_004979 [Penicillium canariense]KAJ5166198.1 hypothetical protein N7482_004979 [Penicillium canariense]